MEGMPAAFVEASQTIQELRKREAVAQKSGGRRPQRFELDPAPMYAALALAAQRLRAVGMHDDCTLRFLRTHVVYILHQLLHDTNVVYRREGVAQRLAVVRAALDVVHQLLLLYKPTDDDLLRERDLICRPLNAIFDPTAFFHKSHWPFVCNPVPIGCTTGGSGEASAACKTSRFGADVGMGMGMGPMWLGVSQEYWHLHGHRDLAANWREDERELDREFCTTAGNIDAVEDLNARDAALASHRVRYAPGKWPPPPHVQQVSTLTVALRYFARSGGFGALLRIFQRAEWVGCARASLLLDPLALAASSVMLPKACEPLLYCAAPHERFCSRPRAHALRLRGTVLGKLCHATSAERASAATGETKETPKVSRSFKLRPMPTEMFDALVLRERLADCKNATNSAAPTTISDLGDITVHAEAITCTEDAAMESTKYSAGRDASGSDIGGIAPLLLSRLSTLNDAALKQHFGFSLTTDDGMAAASEDELSSPRECIPDAAEGFRFLSMSLEKLLLAGDRLSFHQASRVIYKLRLAFSLQCLQCQYLDKRLWALKELCDLSIIAMRHTRKQQYVQLPLLLPGETRYEAQAQTVVQQLEHNLRQQCIQLHEQEQVLTKQSAHDKNIRAELQRQLRHQQRQVQQMQSLHTVQGVRQEQLLLQARVLALITVSAAACEKMEESGSNHWESGDGGLAQVQVQEQLAEVARQKRQVTRVKSSAETNVDSSLRISHDGYMLRGAAAVAIDADDGTFGAFEDDAEHDDEQGRIQDPGLGHHQERVDIRGVHDEQQEGNGISCSQSVHARRALQQRHWLNAERLLLRCGGIISIGSVSGEPCDVAGSMGGGQNKHRCAEEDHDGLSSSCSEIGNCVTGTDIPSKSEGVAQQTPAPTTKHVLAWLFGASMHVELLQRARPLLDFFVRCGAFRAWHLERMWVASLGTGKRADVVAELHSLIVHTVKATLHVFPPPAIAKHEITYTPEQTVKEQMGPLQFFHGPAVALHLFGLIRKELEKAEANASKAGDGSGREDTSCADSGRGVKTEAGGSNVAPILQFADIRSLLLQLLPLTVIPAPNTNRALLESFVALAWRLREKTRVPTALERALIEVDNHSGNEKQVHTKPVLPQNHQGEAEQMDKFVQNVLKRATTCDATIADTFITRSVDSLRGRCDAIFSLRVLTNLLRCRGELCASLAAAQHVNTLEIQHAEEYGMSLKRDFDRHGLLELLLQTITFYASPAACINAAKMELAAGSGAELTTIDSHEKNAGMRNTCVEVTRQCLELLHHALLHSTLELEMVHIRRLWMAARQPLRLSEGSGSSHRQAENSAAIRLQQCLRDNCSDWLNQCCEGVTQQFLARAFRLHAHKVDAIAPEHEAGCSCSGPHVPFAEDLHERIFTEIVCGLSTEDGSHVESGIAKHDVNVSLRNGVDLTRSGLRCFQSWMRLANVRRGSASFCVVCDDEQKCSKIELDATTKKATRKCECFFMLQHEVVTVDEAATQAQESKISTICGLEQLWKLVLYGHNNGDDTAMSNCDDSTTSVLHTAMMALIDTHINIRRVCPAKSTTTDTDEEPAVSHHVRRCKCTGVPTLFISMLFRRLVESMHRASANVSSLQRTHVQQDLTAQRRLLELLHLSIERWPHAVRSHIDSASADFARFVVHLTDPFANDPELSLQLLREGDTRDNFDLLTERLQTTELRDLGEATNHSNGLAIATEARTMRRRAASVLHRSRRARHKRASRYALMGVGMPRIPAPFFRLSQSRGDALMTMHVNTECHCLKTSAAGIFPSIDRLNVGWSSTNPSKLQTVLPCQPYSAIEVTLPSSDSVAALRRHVASVLSNEDGRGIELYSAAGLQGRRRARAHFRARRRQQRRQMLRICWDTGTRTSSEGNIAADGVTILDYCSGDGSTCSSSESGLGSGDDGNAEIPQRTRSQSKEHLDKPDMNTGLGNMRTSDNRGAQANVDGDADVGAEVESEESEFTDDSDVDIQSVTDDSSDTPVNTGEMPASVDETMGVSDSERQNDRSDNGNGQTPGQSKILANALNSADDAASNVQQQRRLRSAPILSRQDQSHIKLDYFNSAVAGGGISLHAHPFIRFGCSSRSEDRCALRMARARERQRCARHQQHNWHTGESHGSGAAVEDRRPDLYATDAIASACEDPPIMLLVNRRDRQHTRKTSHSGTGNTNNGNNDTNGAESRSAQHTRLLRHINRRPSLLVSSQNQYTDVLFALVSMSDCTASGASGSDCVSSSVLQHHAVRSTAWTVLQRLPTCRSVLLELALAPARAQSSFEAARAQDTRTPGTSAAIADQMREQWERWLGAYPTSTTLYCSSYEALYRLQTLCSLLCPPTDVVALVDLAHTFNSVRVSQPEVTPDKVKIAWHGMEAWRRDFADRSSPGCGVDALLNIVRQGVGIDCTTNADAGKICVRVQILCQALRALRLLLQGEWDRLHRIRIRAWNQCHSTAKADPSSVRSRVLKLNQFRDNIFNSPAAELVGEISSAIPGLILDVAKVPTSTNMRVCEIEAGARTAVERLSDDVSRVLDLCRAFAELKSECQQIDVRRIDRAQCMPSPTVMELLRTCLLQVELSPLQPSYSSDSHSRTWHRALHRAALYALRHFVHTNANQSQVLPDGTHVPMCDALLVEACTALERAFSFNAAQQTPSPCLPASSVPFLSMLARQRSSSFDCRRLTNVASALVCWLRQLCCNDTAMRVSIRLVCVVFRLLHQFVTLPTLQMSVPFCASDGAQPCNTTLPVMENAARLELIDILCVNYLFGDGSSSCHNLGHAATNADTGSDSDSSCQHEERVAGNRIGRRTSLESQPVLLQFRTRCKTEIKSSDCRPQSRKAVAQALFAHAGRSDVARARADAMCLLRALCMPSQSMDGLDLSNAPVSRLLDRVSEVCEQVSQLGRQRRSLCADLHRAMRRHIRQQRLQRCAEMAAKRTKAAGEAAIEDCDYNSNTLAADCNIGMDGTSQNKVEQSFAAERVVIFGLPPATFGGEMMGQYEMIPPESSLRQSFKNVPVPQALQREAGTSVFPVYRQILEANKASLMLPADSDASSDGCVCHYLYRSTDGKWWLGPDEEAQHASNLGWMYCDGSESVVYAEQLCNLTWYAATEMYGNSDEQSSSASGYLPEEDVRVLPLGERWGGGGESAVSTLHSFNEDYLANLQTASADDMDTLERQYRDALRKHVGRDTAHPVEQGHDVRHICAATSTAAAALMAARTMDEPWLYDRHEAQQAHAGYVGLVNQGSTCYMNSLLQQLAMLPSFSNGLLSIQPHGSREEAQLESARQAETAAQGNDTTTAESLGGTHRQGNNTKRKFGADNESRAASWGSGGWPLQSVINELQNGSSSGGDGGDGQQSQYLSFGNALFRVVSELQTVLGSLLLSHARAYDPMPLVRALGGADNPPGFFPLDSSVLEQNDASEFFNLLVDRLDAALACTPQRGRELLRRCFGGRLVHQLLGEMQNADAGTGANTAADIDTNEPQTGISSSSLSSPRRATSSIGTCPHSSERHEDFFNIQLEVKGRTCVTDSLASFVKGELLEGENAYMCDKCKIKVPKLKRCCFDEDALPATLVLQLKRFELDYDTFEKVKVNDRFDFPLELDMWPFTRAGLMGGSCNGGDTPSAAGRPKTRYRLRGIVIHAGNAHSGHYYSYIADRSTERWLEFNDEIVRPWDCAQRLETDCFGGVYKRQTTNPNTGRRVMVDAVRHHNAFMLVYDRDDCGNGDSFEGTPNGNNSPVCQVAKRRRRSGGSSDHESLEKTVSASTMAVMPIRLLSNIQKANALLAQNRLAFDPSFQSLVLSVATGVAVRHRDTDKCTAGSDLILARSAQVALQMFMQIFMHSGPWNCSELEAIAPNILVMDTSTLEHGCSVTEPLMVCCEDRISASGNGDDCKFYDELVSCSDSECSTYSSNNSDGEDSSDESNSGQMNICDVQGLPSSDEEDDVAGASTGGNMTKDNDGTDTGDEGKGAHADRARKRHTELVRYPRALRMVWTMRLQQLLRTSSSARSWFVVRCFSHCHDLSSILGMPPLDEAAAADRVAFERDLSSAANGLHLGTLGQSWLHHVAMRCPTSALRRLFFALLQTSLVELLVSTGGNNGDRIITDADARARKRQRTHDNQGGSSSAIDGAYTCTSKDEFSFDENFGLVHNAGTCANASAPTRDNEKAVSRGERELRFSAQLSVSQLLRFSARQLTVVVIATAGISVPGSSTQSTSSGDDADGLSPTAAFTEVLGMLLSLLRAIATDGTKSTLATSHWHAFVSGMLDAGLVRALTIVAAEAQKALAAAIATLYELESDNNHGMGDWDGGSATHEYSSQERRRLTRRVGILRTSTHRTIGALHAILHVLNICPRDGNLSISPLEYQTIHAHQWLARVLSLALADDEASNEAIFESVMELFCTIARSGDVGGTLADTVTGAGAGAGAGVGACEAARDGDTAAGCHAVMVTLLNAMWVEKQHKIPALFRILLRVVLAGVHEPEHKPHARPIVETAVWARMRILAMDEVSLDGSSECRETPAAASSKDSVMGLMAMVLKKARCKNSKVQQVQLAYDRSFRLMHGVLSMGVRSGLIGAWLKANWHLWQWWPEWIYRQMPLIGREEDLRHIDQDSLPSLEIADVLDWVNANFMPFRDQGQGWLSGGNRTSC